MADYGPEDEDCCFTPTSHSGNSHLDGTLDSFASCDASDSSPNSATHLNAEFSPTGGHPNIGTSVVKELNCDVQELEGESIPGSSKAFGRPVQSSVPQHPGHLPDEHESTKQGLAIARPSTAPKEADRGPQVTAQEMFLAGILQAQLCVLDLQDELDKQTDVSGEPVRWSSRPPEGPAVDYTQRATICSTSSEGEEGRFTLDSSEEDLEDMLWSAKDGEGGFSESDNEECHFYNNPLFQGASCVPLNSSPPEAERLRDLGVEALCSKDGKQAIEIQNIVAGDRSVFRTNCPDNSGLKALQFSSEESTNALHCHTLLPGGLTGEGMYCGPAMDTASQTNIKENVPHYKTFPPLANDSKVNSPEHLSQENGVPCSSLECHTLSGDTVAAEGDQVLDEGLLLSDSSFSMIAAFLLDEDCAKSIPSNITQDLSGSTAGGHLPVVTIDIKEGVVDSHNLACTQDLPGSAGKTHVQVPPWSLHSMTLSVPQIHPPPLTPDLISWEEPDPPAVTYFGGRPSSPAHLLDWALDHHSPVYSSSEEEELVDGHGEDESNESAYSECPNAAKNGAEYAESNHTDRHPSPASHLSPFPSQVIEQETTEGLSLSNGTLKDCDAAKILATKLYHLDGFRKSEVAAHLQKNTDFSRMVAQEYLSFFDFTGKTLDQALRSLLKVLVLTGETQERERVLEQFSRRFYHCNPELFSSADAVHTLTCAVMLLNTDLHGKNIGRAMSCSEFIINLDKMNDGVNFPKDQLKELYHSIRNEKLEWAVDEEEARNAMTPKLEPSHSFTRKKSHAFQELSLPDARAETYKQGILARKMHADIDGKRTPWGKRSWKDFYTILKGTMLCLVKEEYRSDYQYSEEVISIHHALAEKASKYNKRPNVFRLQTADWRIYLFQAENDQEMNSWVSRINLVAAMFSAPPFPAAIGSQKRFVRPILPTAPGKLSLEEQRSSHELWMDTFTDDLADHQKNLPDKKSKARDWEEYRTRGEYLFYEKTRYETYVKLLDVKLCSGTDDMSQWEAQLRESSDTTDDGSSLKKSHSSPSLNQDQSPTVKVKRNISERRTYRKIIPKRNKNLA